MSAGCPAARGALGSPTQSYYGRIFSSLQRSPRQAGDRCNCCKPLTSATDHRSSRTTGRMQQRPPVSRLQRYPPFPTTATRARYIFFRLVRALTPQTVPWARDPNGKLSLTTSRSNPGSTNLEESKQSVLPDSRISGQRSDGHKCSSATYRTMLQQSTQIYSVQPF